MEANNPQPKKSNIIGPITKDDWTTLLLLKESVSYLKQKNAQKFKKVIDKESRLYKEILGKYKEAA